MSVRIRSKVERWAMPRGFPAVAGFEDVADVEMGLSQELLDDFWDGERIVGSQDFPLLHREPPQEMELLPSRLRVERCNPPNGTTKSSAGVNEPEVFDPQGWSSGFLRDKDQRATAFKRGS